MNLPNKLTILRLILIPFYIFFLMTDYYMLTSIVAMLIFLAACITDNLDGRIARKRNLITNFGKFADPLADKILVISAMICFVANGRMPFWVLIIIIAREFAVSGFRLVAASNGTVLAASIWGKMKTGWQMSTCMFMTCDIVRLVEGFGWPSVVVTVWHIVELIAMYGALVLTIISMIDYFYKNRNCFTTKE
mgnify:CR=1 FL=1